MSAPASRGEPPPPEQPLRLRRPGARAGSSPAPTRAGARTAVDGTSRRRFQVAEATPKDAGRGILRVHPDDLRALGCEVGDVVLVRAARGATRHTAARVLPTPPEDRRRHTVHLDGIVRQNAGVGISEPAELTRTEAAPALSLVLAPLSSTAATVAAGDTAHASTLLAGIPVVAGDVLRVPLFGSGVADFRATETDPAGPVLIAPTTALTFRGTPPAGAAHGITYEDIGGLKTELGRIRELIELPLKYPEVFERLGIEAPKGVLLTGPPGTGKTLIARAVAQETDATFLSLSGPEIMNKFYGESEGRLREVFAEAEAQAPSIVFIDEIDAIAPKREDMGGERQVERRVVAQLLALMDGIRQRGRVVVIGATNIPNALDPALRRPGRFDRELSLPVPDAPARREILEIHTRGMPLADDVNLQALAAVTHGFVGADLEALAREAAMSVLRSVLPEVDLTQASIPLQTLFNLRVTMDHFRQALAEVEPSALREVFTEVPTVTWADVGGLQEIQQRLREAVEWPLKHQALFAAAQTSPPKGILLVGPPGVGKTLLAKAVAHESGVNFIAVSGPSLVSRYLGESERGIREVFRKARQAAPCIVFFDELDALVPRRGRTGESDVIARMVSQFLVELDGIEELRGVVVLGATNREDLLDPALLRPGRFEIRLNLPLPEENGRAAILAIHTKGRPLARDVQLAALARATAGASGADLAALCRGAALAAIREQLGFTGGRPPPFRITRRHFAEGLAAWRATRPDEPRAPRPL